MSAPESTVVVMALCEPAHVILRAGVTYRFMQMEGCVECAKVAAAYAAEDPAHRCAHCGSDDRVGEHGVDICFHPREQDEPEEDVPQPIGECAGCGTPYYTTEGFCPICNPRLL